MRNKTQKNNNKSMKPNFKARNEVSNPYGLGVNRYQLKENEYKSPNNMTTIQSSRFGKKGPF